MRTHAWKRRTALAALVLLVPLTLAPRTSFTLPSVDYNLVVSSQRGTIPVGGAQPVTFTAVSRTDEVIEQASLVITVSVDGDKAAAQVVAASQGCTVDGSRVACELGPIEARGEASVQVTARGLTKGMLLFDVVEGSAGEDFGTYRLDVTTKRRGASR